MEKAHKDVGFTLHLLSKEAQVSLKRIATLAIRVRSLSDPTAQNVFLMKPFDEVTLAQALAALKSTKPKADKVMLQELDQGTITTTTATTTVIAASTRPKAKGLVIHEQEQAHTPTVSSQQPSQLNVQDKGKGKMVEPEKPMKNKELIRLDEEIASKLQDEFDKEVRLAREKAKKEEEANIVS
ncbi:hypothetical protein Tco_0664101 [Tanacetum coccineum]